MSVTPNDILTLRTLRSRSDATHERRALKLAIDALQHRLNTLGEHQSQIVALLRSSGRALPLDAIATETGLGIARTQESLTRLVNREIVTVATTPGNPLQHYKVL